MSGYHTQLINMTFETSCIDRKPRESRGGSNTDVSLVSKMCFAVLELIQITLSCIYTNSFRIIFWHNKPYRRGLKYQEEEI